MEAKVILMQLENEGHLIITSKEDALMLRDGADLSEVDNLVDWLEQCEECGYILELNIDGVLDYAESQ